jgi:hypothetical protein
MSLGTIHTGNYHELYEMADAATQQTIDAAYQAARKELAHVCKPSNDDPAEELIAALMRYVLESRRYEGATFGSAKAPEVPR